MSAPPRIDRPRKPAPGESGDDGEGVTTLIDSLLAEQRRLTAVEKFSRHHEAHTGPALESHYRDLIPLTVPRPGEQYAFDVDLDRCSGCKGCVTACHALNGLDEDEAWRSVGFLVGEAILPIHDSPVLPTSSLTSRFGNRVIPLQQTVTTACHHCVEPACMLGCPVMAYDKDPVTGIVRHLDDQCIGCSYCILKCPYEVPQYSARRGIVRKCDMCHGRLADGEAPACVQACPNEAIQITLVRPAELVKQLGISPRADAAPSSRWLPDSPDPALSIPTTRYRTRHPTASLRAADHGRPHPAPMHGPLVLMLVLTQAGLGGLTAAAWLAPAGGGSSSSETFLRSCLGFGVLSLALLSAGLVASVFHLGQPRKAWRVWMGWRTSWLSREAIVLNAAAGVAVLAVLMLGLRSPWVPAGIADAWSALIPWGATLQGLFLPAMLVGSTLLAVATQTMVYADTGRTFWSVYWTAPRFAGTALLMGLAAAWALRPGWEVGALLGLLSALKLASEIAVLKHGDSDADQWTPLRRTAVLQRGPLRPLLVVRALLGIAGGLVIPYLVGVGAMPVEFAVWAIPILLLGEMAERVLFFTSVSPDQMPGLPR